MRFPQADVGEIRKKTLNYKPFDKVDKRVYNNNTRSTCYQQALPAVETQTVATNIHSYWEEGLTLKRQ